MKGWLFLIFAISIFSSKLLLRSRSARDVISCKSLALDCYGIKCNQCVDGKCLTNGELGELVECDSKTDFLIVKRS